MYSLFSRILNTFVHTTVSRTSCTLIIINEKNTLTCTTLCSTLFFNSIQNTFSRYVFISRVRQLARTVRSSCRCTNVSYRRQYLGTFVQLHEDLAWLGQELGFTYSRLLIPYAANSIHKQPTLPLCRKTLEVSLLYSCHWKIRLYFV
jgi:hypothetical protein